MARNKNTDNPEGSLFSAEEITRCMGGFDFDEEKPVTVLGITFENEAKRREYFREELRKRLPELRKIEGFPIGSDDDIINLSDPPYYTACPNPWLNDFVDEWEKEKTELEKEGKRSNDFEVKEPYASDVSDIKNDSVYRAHMYHTKVPHKLIMKYLLHYTQPGDIVFDGFAGTGMTGVAAQACGDLEHQDWTTILRDIDTTKIKKGTRHAICGDLSSYASTIAYNYNTPADAINIESEIKRIQSELQQEIGWMFETKESDGSKGTLNCVVWSDIVTCPSCGQEYVLWNQMIDHVNKKINDDILCPHCSSCHRKNEISSVLETVYDAGLGKIQKKVKSVPVLVVTTVGRNRIQRAPNEYDMEVLRKIEETEIKDFYPTYELPEGQETQRNVDKGITNVHQFYTKRNLIALSKLYAKIETSKIGHKLRFVFTGMINRSSKMNKVHFTKYLNGKSDWDAGYLKGTLYIPPFSVESSSMAQIGNKLDRYLKAIPMLTKQCSNALYIGSADNINLKDNSVDYIFTDPPFGANINYSELNVLPEAWLKVVTNNAREAIENRAQGKTAQTYRNTMTACFREYFRVLKPGKWMTVEFSNTSASVWNSIQNALQNAGFVIANVAALNKGQGGIRSVTTTTAVKQDLALSCYKPSEHIVNCLKDKFQIDIWDFVAEHIERLSPPVIQNGKLLSMPERDERILYDRIVSYYIQHGLSVPLNAGEFQKELRERYIERDGMFFNEVQAAEYEEKKKYATEFVPMGIIVSDEANGIQWLKNQLHDEPKTYQELQPEWMQAINGVRKGDILPELKDLLDENFIETEDGKWRLPNIQDDVDKEALRTKALLREFKHYVELAQKPKGKLKEVRVEALRAGFKDCYINKDFQTIVTVGDKIPQNLRDEDETLLQFYDIAMNKL